MIFTLFLFAWGQTFGLETELVFEANTDLGRPVFGDVDTSGRLYLLDFDRKMMFIWNSDGSFAKTLGRPGQGPGELSLSTYAGSMIIFKNEIWVLDESLQKILIWDVQTHEFIKSIPLPGHFNRVELLSVDEHIYALHQNMPKKEQSIVKLNADLDIVQTFLTKPYDMYTRLDQGRFIVRPFANKLGLVADDARIFVWQSLDNQIAVYDHQGVSVANLRAPMPLQEVRESDRDLWRETYRSLGDRAQIEFGDHRNHYDMILSLGGDLWLLREQGDGVHSGQVFQVKPFKKRGTVSLNLGDLHHLLPIGRQLYVMTLSEDGEYQISRRKLTIEDGT